MKDLNKCVFFVDGPTEIHSLKRKFLQDYYVSPVVRITGCNGKDVSIDGYVSASFGTLLLALNDSFHFIIFIVDRESRDISSPRFATRLKNALINEVISRTRHREADLIDKIFVCIPDRMFENWILADIDGIKSADELIIDSAVQNQFDGHNGVSELKK